MSYILDALKKAAEQRDAQAPAMRRLFSPAPDLPDSPRWRMAFVGGAAAVAGAVVTVWVLWPAAPLVTEKAAAPSTTARAQAETPGVQVETPPSVHPASPAPPVARTAATSPPAPVKAETRSAPVTAPAVEARRQAPVESATAPTVPRPQATAESAPTSPVQARQAPAEPAPMPPVQTRQAPAEPAPMPPVQARQAPAEPAPTSPVQPRQAAVDPLPAPAAQTRQAAGESPVARPQPATPPALAAVRPTPAAAPPPVATPPRPDVGGPMRLEVIVYSEEGARRLAFINGRKYVEGDVLLDGSRIQEIQPNAVVIIHDGRRVVLKP